MGKIISWSWAEKDDPMFTGLFHVNSVKNTEFGQKNIKNKKTDL